MIMTVDELKQYIYTQVEDKVLEGKLQALELLIRKYTNNNFQKRNIRFKCPVMSTKIYLTTDFLNVGDSIQISDSLYSNGVYDIKKKEDGFIDVGESLFDEPKVLVTKVEYPVDVKMGVVNMVKYDLENRAKVGIQSETISRHSVTYFDQSASNTSIGYPVSLVGFLKPYMKARF